MADVDSEHNDKVWGAGNWVACNVCNGVHHKAYHDRDFSTSSAPKRELEPNADLVAQLAAFERVVSALIFYADPATYHAIGFFPDPPCGAFMDDFSEHGNPDYPEGDQRPGKMAREALQAWWDATEIPT